MEYKDWLNEWLDLYVQPTTKPRTCKKYKRQIEIHIFPALGGYELRELTSIVLQRFIVDLAKKGLSANTVNGIASLLKASLKRAVQVGVADKEFSSVIVRPKGKEKSVECFSKEEQKKIEQNIFHKNNPKHFGIVLTLYTGLRIGELLALTWDDTPVIEKKWVGSATYFNFILNDLYDAKSGGANMDKVNINDPATSGLNGMQFRFFSDAGWAGWDYCMQYVKIAKDGNYKEGEQDYSASLADPKVNAVTKNIWNDKKINVRIDSTADKYILTLTAYGDDGATIVAVADPADVKIIYESSDETVATVDASGKITAVGSGTATVTAKIGSKQAACTVTVKADGESGESANSGDSANSGESGKESSGGCLGSIASQALALPAVVSVFGLMLVAKKRKDN